MNADDALADVLGCLSDGQIDALAAACQPLGRPDGGVAAVIAGAPPSAHAALSALASAWAAAPRLTGAGIALALRTGLTARRAADASRAQPVWTGPGAVGEQRLTAAVLHELLAGATERILLVSYAAYTLPELAADLEAAVSRGCQVDAVFETTEDSAGAYTSHARPFADLTGITRWRWPAEHRSAGAVLHAKLLVIDGQRAFIGSANLTARALHQNLEAGLLVHTLDVASQLEQHVRQLMQTNVLRREPDVLTGNGGDAPVLA